jgi:purine-binding chemotaxis protein CheW
MAEGRKRGGKKPPPPPRPPADEPLPQENWVTREEALFFPGDVPRGGGAASRISLPSSGLAEDILSRAEAARVDDRPSEPAEVTSLEPAPAASQGEVSTRVHNISFFAAPAREEKKAIEAQEHLVTFYLAKEEYAVDVRLVQEIIRVTEITPVPRAPASIKGVINLRGRIIPVVDLRTRLSLGQVEATRLARVVVVKLRERLVGLLVDGVSQVLKVPISTIEPAPEEVVEIDANYIRGVAKLEKRLIILVDLPKILGVDLRDAIALAPSN